jgi:hypothetical protein
MNVNIFLDKRRPMKPLDLLNPEGRRWWAVINRGFWLAFVVLVPVYTLINQF